jgi:hypothetical protein
MSYSNGYVWTFQQLPLPGKSLTLGGWQAPFGRPRHGSIFNAGLEVRHSRTDYPGQNIAPTIHKFGTTLKPIELKGRWMDRMISGDTAMSYVRKWKDFVSDQRITRMTWGGLISYQVFIHEIDLNVEGPGDVAWSMKLESLVDEQGPVTVNPTATQAPFDIASNMMALMVYTHITNPPVGYTNLLGMLNQVSDQLAVLRSQINAPFATIYNTCQALTTFETAVSSDLTSVLSGIQAMRTGLTSLRQTTDFMADSASQINSAPVILNGSDMIRFTTDKQTQDVGIDGLLKSLRILEIQIDQVRRGKKTRAYHAKDGDTWESIGDATSGSADAGRKIRSMNGIEYGQRPMPGRTYTIPQ